MPTHNTHDRSDAPATATSSDADEAETARDDGTTDGAGTHGGSSGGDGGTGDSTDDVPPIVLERVTKRYGPATALDNVSLEIRPGTFHGLLGPNGSGKTTLFRLVAGLTRPTDGRVDRPDTAAVGFSFQEPRFYPELTVRENLSVFRRFVDDPPPADWQETLLEELRLAPAAHRRAADLSGGFRKKLDLALALLKRPTYLLLDEPLADVDEHSRRRIRAFLADYCSEGRTVLVTTHNVADFADTFDRVTVLVDGHLEADGPPEADVLAQYRSVLEGR